MFPMFFLCHVHPVHGFVDRHGAARCVVLPCHGALRIWIWGLLRGSATSVSMDLCTSLREFRAETPQLQ